MDKLLCGTKLDNLDLLCNNLVWIVAFGFIIFFSFIAYVIEYNCNNCSSHFGYGSYAFGLSVPQSNSSTLVLDPNINAQVYFKGIKFPSSMAFLGPDDLLVLEKNEGTVKRIVNGTMLKDPLLKVNVSSTGEGGLLGIAVAKPNSTNNKPTYIFLYFTEALKKTELGDENSYVPGSAMNRLYRYEIINNKMANPKLIFQLPPQNTTVHNGGSIVVGPDNNVYVGIGDLSRTDPEKDELPNGRAGILRFTQDGNTVITDGHTLLGKLHPLNKYYGYGIRNSFGMDFDPASGKLWDTENGPDFGDEINIVEPGFNSGWAKIQGFWITKYPLSNHTTLIPPADLLNLDGKLKYSYPELATKYPAGLTALAFINSTNYGKQYENDMFVGDFHNGYIYHFDLNTNRSAIVLNGPLEDRIANNPSELKDVIFGRGFGGITDIEIGPDGNIYVLAVYQGGDNCTADKKTECIGYSSSMIGTIFKIVSVNSSLVQKKQK
jgi:aldose sugar dehydrogenase